MAATACREALESQARPYQHTPDQYNRLKWHIYKGHFEVKGSCPNINNEADWAQNHFWDNLQITEIAIKNLKQEIELQTDLKARITGLNLTPDLMDELKGLFYKSVLTATQKEPNLRGEDDWGGKHLYDMDKISCLSQAVTNIERRLAVEYASLRAERDSLRKKLKMKQRLSNNLAPQPSDYKLEVINDEKCPQPQEKEASIDHKQNGTKKTPIERSASVTKKRKKRRKKQRISKAQARKHAQAAELQEIVRKTKVERTQNNNSYLQDMERIFATARSDVRMGKENSPDINAFRVLLLQSTRESEIQQNSHCVQFIRSLIEKSKSDDGLKNFLGVQINYLLQS